MKASGPAADADMIAADPPLAVKERGRRNPFAVNFYLFEERDTGRFSHLGSLVEGLIVALGSFSYEPPIASPINVLNARFN